MAIQKKKRKRTTPDIARKRKQLARPSPLLSLPAELRKEIYKYALSATSDLLVKMVRGTSRSSKKPKLTDDDSPEQDFNQIKFVNRQLYTETAGMEVSFNKIVFATQVGAKSYRPVHRHFQFVKECAPGKRKWLRHIDLVEPLTPKDRYMVSWFQSNRSQVIALLKLCIATPNLTLHFYIPGWPADLREFNAAYDLIIHGSVLEWMFRGKDLTGMIPFSGQGTLRDFDHTYIRLMLIRDSEEVRSLGALAPNLRLHPTSFVLDEERFRQDAFKAWCVHADDPQLLPHNAIDDWVSHIRNWVSDGI